LSPEVGRILLVTQKAVNTFIKKFLLISFDLFFADEKLNTIKSRT